MTASLTIVSDLHVNSTVGLCPRSVNLDDKGTYYPNKTQKWLWRYWLDAWEQTKEFIQGVDTKILLVNGDAVDADHKNRSNQYVTGNQATILKMAVQVLEPGLSVVDKVLFIRGTPAHVGKDAEMEEELANDILNVVRDEDAKTPDKTAPASWWHYRGMIENVAVDFTHHTSMGTLAWTDKNAANKIAADAIMQYTLAGQRLPQLVIRSHVHRHADSHDNYPVRAIVTPAWQSMTGYGAKLNPNRLSDIGMITLLIDDNKIYNELKVITKLSQNTRSVWTNRL